MKKTKSLHSSPSTNSPFFIRFVNEDIGRLVYPNGYKVGFDEQRLTDNSKKTEALQKLRALLNNIIENQKVVDTDELKYFTKVLEQSTPEYRVKDGKLIKKWKSAKTGTEYLFYTIWLRDLSEDLINYLSEPNADIRKLKKCPYCHKFFIAKNIYRKTRCYESDCEKSYQRDKKRKQRELEPDIYY